MFFFLFFSLKPPTLKGSFKSGLDNKKWKILDILQGGASRHNQVVFPLFPATPGNTFQAREECWMGLEYA